MRKISLSAFLILLLNSAYLFSFGEPTLFYIFNVLLHVGLGIVLILPFSIYVYKYLARSSQADNQKERISILGQTGAIGIIVGVITGGYLMIVGATTPYRWLLIAHIVSVGVGSLLFSVYLLRDSHLLTPSLRKVGVAVLIGIVLFPIGARLTQHYLPNETYLVENPALPPRACTKKGAAQPATSSLHPSKQRQAH